MNNRMVDEEGKEHFRLSKENFMLLCRKLEPILKKEMT